MRAVTFIGAPSTGKGSFGKLIAQKAAGWVHLSLGEYMRKEIDKETTLGAGISISMAEGRLVPDHLANEIAKQSLIEFQAKKTSVVILDGYPRTVNQAEYLVENFPKIGFSAVHIMLERWVAIEKTLGRQCCKTCGGSFNSADIQSDGFFMPAIVPNSATCPLGDNCNPVLEKRLDDTVETAEVRYQEYLLKTTPLLEWYDNKKQLLSFRVKKGMADVDLLTDLINGTPQ